jgi:hypothetical protein
LQVPPESDSQVEQLFEPLHELLIRYRRAAERLAHVIGTIESALRHESGGARIDRPVHARIETSTSELDAIMAFQDLLAELPGVLKVTVTGAAGGRASLLVELATPTSPKLVCSSCGKVLREGSEPASHGLCADCQGSFGLRP